MKRFKKSIALLLAFCLVLSMTATSIFAEEAEEPKTICLGTSCIKSPTETTNVVEGDSTKVYQPNSYIYFGTYDNTSYPDIKWRVLDAENGNATGNGDFLAGIANAGAMFLLSEYGLDSGIRFDDDSNVYQGSKAQTWCKNFVDERNIFSVLESAAILPTWKSDAAGTYIHDCSSGESTLNEDKMFFLSVEEYEKYINTIEASQVLHYDTSTNCGWWFRSPEDNNTGSAFFNLPLAMQGGLSPMPVNSTTYSNLPNAARPAFNLDKSSVLFTQAADNSGQSNTFAVPNSYAGNEWKLTLTDENDFSDGASLAGSESDSSEGLGIALLDSGYAATDLVINHKSLASFAAGYTDVTALLTDGGSNILYYGSINTDSNATKSTVTIPAGLADGEYSLYIYGEDRNNAKQTDYATMTPYEVILYVGIEPPENDEEEIDPTTTEPTTTDPTDATPMPTDPTDVTDPTESENDDATGTGDSFNILPWLILATASMIGIVAFTSRRKTMK